MSTDLIPFEYSGRRVRAEMADNEPWFVLADVCTVLDLSNPSMVARSLDDDDLRTVEVIDSMSRSQSAHAVSEPGLYQLVFQSRKPEAKTFRRWVTREVLPALRKTGSYSLAVPEDFPSALRALAAEFEEKQALKARNAAIEPAAHSWNTLADAQGDYSLREAAQILDRDPSIKTGQNRLARWLRNFGWTDHKGQPYQRHVDNGRLVVRSRSYDHPVTGEPQATTQIRITVKGLEALHQEMGGSGPLLRGVAS